MNTHTMFAVKKVNGGYFQGYKDGVLYFGKIADNFLEFNTEIEATKVALILSKPSVAGEKCIAVEI